jgi:hypothetical protein
MPICLTANATTALPALLSYDALKTPPHTFTRQHGTTSHRGDLIALCGPCDDQHRTLALRILMNEDNSPSSTSQKPDGVLVTTNRPYEPIAVPLAPGIPPDARSKPCWHVPSTSENRCRRLRYRLRALSLTRTFYCGICTACILLHALTCANIVSFAT